MSYLRYPVFGGLIVDPSSRELWDNIVLLPLRLRVGGLWAYRLVFAGASWTVLVSRHYTLGIEPYFLTEDGTLRLPTIGWPDFARETGLPETARSVLPPAAI